MGKIAFVILHYNTVEDTEACVKSIHDKCLNHDYHIYIVDNASPNGSGKLILEKYGSDNKISTILCNDNLGFAKGNNLGIEQALKDEYSDFIVVLNNDTKILHNDFCEKIMESYALNKFAVLGPTIYTPKGCSSINPGRLYFLKGKELDSWEKFYKNALALVKCESFFKLKMLRKMRRWKQRLKMCWKISAWKQKLKISRNTKLQYTENCVLHGCCLIFSKDFFKIFKGFDSRTFLYFEEEILYAHVINSGLKTVYDPSVEIWHKEDGATDSVFGTGKEKIIFLYENILKSISVYRKVLKEYGID